MLKCQESILIIRQKIMMKKKVMYYSKNGKISCKDVEKYVKEIDYSSFLDVGSGTGYLIDMLSKEKEANYYGLDLSEEMIKVAEGKNIKNANFILGQADNLPFNSESMDIVSCVQSFHHYPYPEKAMSEAFRVLKKKEYMCFRTQV